jgi:hypothetical protein
MVLWILILRVLDKVFLNEWLETLLGFNLPFSTEI